LLCLQHCIQINDVAVLTTHSWYLVPGIVPAGTVVYVAVPGFLDFDNFYTGLSPRQPCVSSGLFFSYDQDCSDDYLVTGPMVGTNFSHGFAVYSCIFGQGVSKSAVVSEALHPYSILWNTGTA